MAAFTSAIYRPQGVKKNVVNNSFSQAIYRSYIPEDNLSPWDERAAFQGPPHLWAAPQQGIPLTLRLQMQDSRQRGGHPGVWSYGYFFVGRGASDECIHSAASSPVDLTPKVGAVGC